MDRLDDYFTEIYRYNNKSIHVRAILIFSSSHNRYLIIYENGYIEYFSIFECDKAGYDMECVLINIKTRLFEF